VNVLKGENLPCVVVCTCNPSYSGGRSRKISSSRPAWAKVAQDKIKIAKKLNKNKMVREVT
jgi:hypothetical protein